MMKRWQFEWGSGHIVEVPAGVDVVGYLRGFTDCYRGYVGHARRAEEAADLVALRKRAAFWRAARENPA